MNNKYIKIFKINILFGRDDNRKKIISEIENTPFYKEFKNKKKKNIYEKIEKLLKIIMKYMRLKKKD